MYSHLSDDISVSVVSSQNSMAKGYSQAMSINVRDSTVHIKSLQKLSVFLLEWVLANLCCKILNLVTSVTIRSSWCKSIMSNSSLDKDLVVFELGLMKHFIHSYCLVFILESLKLLSSDRNHSLGIVFVEVQVHLLSWLVRNTSHEHEGGYTCFIGFAAILTSVVWLRVFSDLLATWLLWTSQVYYLLIVLYVSNVAVDEKEVLGRWLAKGLNLKAAALYLLYHLSNHPHIILILRPSSTAITSWTTSLWSQIYSFKLLSCLRLQTVVPSLQLVRPRMSQA